MKLDFLAGDNLWDALQSAVTHAADGQTVTFDFNDREYTINPHESFEDAKIRAEHILGGSILSPDEMSAKARADLERTEREWTEAIAQAGAATEAEMRATKVPWLKTSKELTAYIKTLTNRPHDYGTCVYALSMAATAAFQHVASVLGVTGFQASCADLDIVRRTRGIDGPFVILKAEDLLYPQYDLDEKLRELKESSREWLRTEAIKKLAEASDLTHPAVLAHWQKLAS